MKKPRGKGKGYERLKLIMSANLYIALNQNEIDTAYLVITRSIKKKWKMSESHNTLFHFFELFLNLFFNIETKLIENEIIKSETKKLNKCFYIFLRHWLSVSKPYVNFMY